MTFRLLHNIGRKFNENYNTPEEILACNDVLTFDGVYRNVWTHKEILTGKDVYLFVTGDYVGKDNRFDVPMPLELFADWNEIMQIVEETGAKLGWHTWSHRDLTLLNEDEIRKELTPPFPMPYIAYPYGKFDERVLRIAKELGYIEGFSVHQGNGEPLQLKRAYL